MMRLKPGEPAPVFTMPDINGATVALDDFRGKYLLLSFYRYASCPFCNLRIHELTQRYDDFLSLGMEQLAVFQSPAEKIRQYVGREQRPFVILPDPERQLYRRYGVETSWLGMLKAFAGRMPEIARAMNKGFLPGSMEGEKHRIPADFLIDKQGNLALAYYGGDIGDHLPLKRLEHYLTHQQSAMESI